MRFSLLVGVLCLGFVFSSGARANLTSSYPPERFDLSRMLDRAASRRSPLELAMQAYYRALSAFAEAANREAPAETVTALRTELARRMDLVFREIIAANPELRTYLTQAQRRFGQFSISFRIVDGDTLRMTVQVPIPAQGQQPARTRELGNITLTPSEISWELDPLGE